MLVVVYLRDARCHTVVPEEFIFALVERSLKNRGLNSNQNRRIYFSREVFEKLQRNETTYQILIFQSPKYIRCQMIWKKLALLAAQSANTSKL